VEDKAKIAASYALDLKTSSTMKFEPFDEGLPRSGQWRYGFELVDMNGDGHLDIVLDIAMGMHLLGMPWAPATSMVTAGPIWSRYPARGRSWCCATRAGGCSPGRTSSSRTG
jgi:hypothetical protein